MKVGRYGCVANRPTRLYMPFAILSFLEHPNGDPPWPANTRLS
jgi:hypothetical protein